jgi:hypothetical protein
MSKTLTTIIQEAKNLVAKPGLFHAACDAPLDERGYCLNCGEYVEDHDRDSDPRASKDQMSPRSQVHEEHCHHTTSHVYVNGKYAETVGNPDGILARNGIKFYKAKHPKAKVELKITPCSVKGCSNYMKLKLHEMAKLSARGRSEVARFSKSVERDCSHLMTQPELDASGPGPHKDTVTHTRALMSDGKVLEKMKISCTRNRNNSYPWTVRGKIKQGHSPDQWIEGYAKSGWRKE